MKPRVMYIEQKTDDEGNLPLDDKGPAIVAKVSFSRTGKTIYCDGKTYRRLEGGGWFGNYRCEEDGNEYWISGVKMDGSNRLKHTEKLAKKERNRRMNGGN
ncbi:MAG: 1-deoxy-D-xylulose-5-phosphate synthase [Gemmataceae bacterium]